MVLMILKWCEKWCEQLFSMVFNGFQWFSNGVNHLKMLWINIFRLGVK